jgi:excisionase family DNA binding protein
MTQYNNLKQLLTVEDVSKKLQISKQLVLILIKTGDLPGIKINSRVYRIKQNDLEKYIESKMYQAQTL